MSQEQLDTLRRLADAFGRRDFESAIQGFAPDVELHPAVRGLDTEAVYHGRDELRRFWDEINEAWDAQTIEVQEMIEAPPDRVVSVERWHVRGRDGIELDFGVVDVYTFRDGLVARIDGFRDRAEALAAAGL